MEVQNMSPKKRFVLGGIGALLPIVLSLTTLVEIDIDSIPQGKIIGNFIKNIALFFLGGFIAYLHDDENKAYKIVELGIAAPALALTLMANSNLIAQHAELQKTDEAKSQPDLRQPKESNKNESRVIDLFDFHIIKSANAEESENKSISDNKFLSDIIKGLKGDIFPDIETENSLLIKSTAISTNKSDEYKFSIFIDSDNVEINTIKQVEYYFEHPSFENQHVILKEEEAENKFLYTYTGWGCLTSVNVIIVFKNGSSKKLDFDMCRSLGPEWSE